MLFDFRHKLDQPARIGMIITPHAAKKTAKAIRADVAELRATMAKARAMKSAPRGLLDIEYADSMVLHVWYARRRIARIRVELRGAVVEKYSNISPAAALRLSRSAL